MNEEQLKARLDRPDREKIARILCDVVADTYSKDKDISWEQIGLNERNWFLATADLIYPNEEEQAEVVGRFRTPPEELGIKLDNAKREERERIAELLDGLNHIALPIELAIKWQALKSNPSKKEEKVNGTK